VAKEDVHLDHFLVLEQGKLEALAPKAPFEEGATLELKPVEVGLHDPHAAVAKLDGYDVVVANAAKLVGKKVKAEITRVLPDAAYATVVTRAKDRAAPVTAEGEAEKPTRKPSGKAAVVPAAEEAVTVTGPEAAAEDDVSETAASKKKTRRGSRGGRRRKKAPTIHVPEAELGGNGDEPESVAAVAEQPVASADGAQPEQATDTPKKRKTRRGSRGGRNRRKKPAAAAPAETAESG
jgi:predicted RNA-binding protein with TRAM domain